MYLSFPLAKKKKAFGYCNPEHRSSIHLILIALQPYIGQKELCFCNLLICSHPNAGTGSRLENLGGTLLSKAQGKSKNHYDPRGRMAAGVRWWLFLGSQCVPVRPLPSWTGSVLVNPIYGIKECLSSNMLCGFVTVSKAPSAAADLLPQVRALMLLQHLLVNYLLKVGNVLSLVGMILTIMCWKSWMSAGISVTFY